MDKKSWVWIGLAIVATAIGAFFILLFSLEEPDDGSYKSVRLDTPEASESVSKGDLLSHGDCSGEGPVTLTHSPMDLEDFSHIVPYGLTVAGHVTPIDHQYFSPTDWSLGRDSYNVYAMADGKIVDIQYRTGSDEYRLVFMHTCTFFTYYDLVTSLTPDILEEFEVSQNNGYAPVGIDVKAGQLIGRIGGQTLDFAVWNTEMELAGYVYPEHYENEAWKMHTDNPYTYYSAELLDQLMTKTLRTADPIEGKIDHDIEGTLQGVWFVKDTNWYKGNQEPYWKTHLSISPDHWDPTGFIFSIGDYDGEAMQFGLSRDSLMPSTITKETGLVKYELHQYGWSDSNGQDWDRKEFIDDITYKTYPQISGVALVQVLENNELQVEVFPNKVFSEVSGFTSSSTIYER